MSSLPWCDRCQGRHDVKHLCPGRTSEGALHRAVRERLTEETVRADSREQLEVAIFQSWSSRRQRAEQQAREAERAAAERRLEAALNWRWDGVRWTRADDVGNR